MATVTPNYSWPVPQSTDFVKDGADAIKDLGDAIDATVFGLPTGGLTLISATTVSVAAAAISVNDCFSATYDNYFAIVELLPVSTGTLNFRFRNSGSDRTDSAYTFNSTAYNSAGTLVGNYGSGTSAVIMQSFTGINSNGVLQIQNPFLSKTKYLQNHYYTLSSAGSNTSGTSGLIYSTANSNDGFSIFSSAGNITGKISVYGYQN